METEGQKRWRVGVVDWPPYVKIEEERVRGRLIEIWEEFLARSGSRGEYESFDSFQGLVRAVESGRVEVALAPFALSDLQDFKQTRAVFPLAQDRLALVQEDRRGTVSIFRLAKKALASHLPNVIEGFMISLFLSLLLYWFERRHERQLAEATSNSQTQMSETLRWSMLAVGNNCSNIPFRSLGARLISAAAIIFSSVVVAAYFSFVKTQLAEDYQSLNAFKDQSLDGKRVGVVSGSLGAAYVQNLIKSSRSELAQLRYYPNERLALQALTQGQPEIDLVIGQESSLSYLLKAEFSKFRKLHLTSQPKENHWLSVRTHLSLAPEVFQQLNQSFAQAQSHRQAQGQD